MVGERAQSLTANEIAHHSYHPELPCLAFASVHTSDTSVPNYTSMDSLQLKGITAQRSKMTSQQRLHEKMTASGPIHTMQKLGTVNLWQPFKKMSI